MHTHAKLRFRKFGSDSLSLLREDRQRRYLIEYLADLGATSVVEEPHYFDRDYLSEFTAFYGSTARGYPNVCQRLHFFSGARVTRSSFARALAGGEPGKSLAERYLGFVVLRPLPEAPIGRTVLRWYVDQDAATTPRITTPSRKYEVHLAGLPLAVRGLAWQQQDSAVSACATVALWSMLHSSAFDDHHAIPTTAQITRLAYSRGASASRVFPSPGLTAAQICEAIREAGLEPAVASAGVGAFPVARFASVLATFLRGGYPVIVLGTLLTRDTNGSWAELGGHAACAVGFREAVPKFSPGNLVAQDEGVQRVYLHDDNIGPNARFTVQPHSGSLVGAGASEVALLVRHPPNRAASDTSYALLPQTLVAAVHENLRSSNDAIQAEGLRAGRSFLQVLVKPQPALAVTVRFARIASYMSRDLTKVLGEGSRALARARMELAERVPPLSLYVGVARVGDPLGALFDVLYDTTDSDHHVRALATVAYHPNVALILERIRGVGLYEYGTVVNAF